MAHYDKQREESIRKWQLEKWPEHNTVDMICQMMTEMNIIRTEINAIKKELEKRK